MPARLVGRGPRQQVRRQVWCRWGGLPIPHLTHAGFVWRDATTQPWVKRNHMFDSQPAPLSLHCRRYEAMSRPDGLVGAAGAHRVQTWFRP